MDMMASGYEVFRCQPEARGFWAWRVFLPVDFRAKVKFACGDEERLGFAPFH
jgi:hypothetical protein